MLRFSNARGNPSETAVRARPRSMTPFAPWVFALVLALAFAAPFSAQASGRRDSLRCDLAAAHAAESTGVPIDLLLAITRVETGRSGAGPEPEPWPWTINANGAGQFFGSRAEAVAAAEAHLSDGTGTFDIGCFQLNLRWHGAAFATLDEMFDPVRNAEYAAGFLLELYRESGDWKRAVAAYHSRTPELAAQYVSRVRAVLEGPEVLPPPLAAEASMPRENLFPLLQAGTQGSAGSLVPLGTARGPLIGGSS